jgi:hypothetical protein
VQLLNAGDETGLPSRYAGKIVNPVSKHRMIILEALGLMPLLTCAAVQRVAFVSTMRGVPLPFALLARRGYRWRDFLSLDIGRRGWIIAIVLSLMAEVGLVEEFLFRGLLIVMMVHAAGDWLPNVSQMLHTFGF